MRQPVVPVPTALRALTFVAAAVLCAGIALSPATARPTREKAPVRKSRTVGAVRSKPQAPPSRTKQSAGGRAANKPALASVAALREHIAVLKAQARAHEASRERSRAGKERAGEKAAEAGGAGPRKDEAREAGVDYLEAYLFYLEQRAYPRDSVDWSAYDRATETREQAAPARLGGGTGADALGAQWEFVGPQNLPVPYRTYFGVGATSGRVNGLAYDPNTPGTAYLASAHGGVWKTTDSGENWTPLGDQWPFLQTTCIAVHPTDSNTLYVGTGDFNGYGAYGFGIMKSTDGGATWTNLGRDEFGRFAVSALVIDPQDPEILTVTTGRPPGWYGHIWRSTDGGATWSQVTDAVGVAWSDIEVGAASSGGNRYYYAAGHYYGGQVWRSADQGATWTRLTPPLSDVNWFDHTSLEIATSPTDPDTVYLIDGFDKKVLKSGNAGASWSDITGTFPQGGNSYNWSQAWYDFHLTCSTVLAGGSPRDVLYAGAITLAQSVAGGPSWTDLGRTFTNQALTHNDQQCLAINPFDPNEMLVGNDGGVYGLSYDPATGTWAFNTSLSRRLGITQFYKAAFHPTDPNRMLGGTQDNATPLCTGDLDNWRNVGGGDGGFVAINPIEPGIQYTTSQNLGTLYRTVNEWRTSTTFTPNWGADRRAFIAPITLDPSQPHLLYAGTNYLWRYNQNTSTWTPRLGGRRLSAQGYLLAVTVAPSDSNRIYTGSSQGELWMTADGGATWTQIDTGAPSLPNRAITCIEVNPADPGDILVGVSGTGTSHLWGCADTTAATRVWSNRGGAGLTGLPDVPLNAIARDIDDPVSTLYVGTDVGVFATADGGETWTNATAPLGLPNVQINDLKAVPGTRFLNAATSGRGMWRIRLSTPVTLSALSVAPAAVPSGEGAAGTVVLSGPAPAGGVAVNLASSDPDVAAVPDSVTVAAGETEVTFPVSTSPVAAAADVTITATYNGSSEAATLTVQPAVPAAGVP